MRRYRLGSHAKYDLKVHVVWCPKYRKRVLTGAVATRVRDLLRQIAVENELHIISGKVAADHVHMFISYQAHQNISQIVQWLKGTSSRLLFQEFPHFKKHYWGELAGLGKLVNKRGNGGDLVGLLRNRQLRKVSRAVPAPVQLKSRLQITDSSPRGVSRGNAGPWMPSSRHCRRNAVPTDLLL